MGSDNTIIGLQIIGLLFAFCMIYFAILSYKRGELNGMEIASWLTMWALAIVIVVFPELLRPYAMTFLVTRVFDLMVLGGFIVVISIVSGAYIRTKKNEKKLEDLVRKVALKNDRKKK
jgi:hypothetical protein